jgi:hypothetical protein
MTQRKNILEKIPQSPLMAKESPLSYEPRILRSKTVKRNLEKEFIPFDVIKPTNKTVKK